jgi:class 3 adenylate cyclase/tetratricopeptide (TPR) repeat protein
MSPSTEQDETASLPDERLRRYLPPGLIDALPGPQERAARTLAHLATARDAIATYLPRRVLHQALAADTAPPWLLWVEGSLLFADLSGSTALAEQLGALGREGTEIVTDFLNAIFGAMTDVVQSRGGDLVAFGGDALLVLFEGQEHARTAAGAALALQEALHGYVRTVAGVGRFPMHLHIGVESGRVAIVGGGTAREQHYSALGRVVNGVALAEGQAGPGEVVLGPQTRALVPSALGEERAGGALLLRRLDDTYAGAMPTALYSLPPLPEPARTLDELDRISPFLPAALLDRILAAPEQPRLEADLRPVTAVFAQVVGLEHLAEALPPDGAAQAAQCYIVAMQEAVGRYGGVVNKLDIAEQGVKLLAIFGAPTAYEDHIERAARAALEMQARLDEVNSTITTLLAARAAAQGTGDPMPWANAMVGNASLVPRPSPLVLPLAQRIGINVGVAFAGNIGSTARKEYTVMGDAVNVAARVMASAAWGEVWCGAEVARAIASRLVCASRGTISLKGKAAPLELFRVAGERDTTSTVMAAYRAMGRLVGRSAELAVLHEHLAAALAGHGRAVCIVGEVGMGKSHLSAALVEEATERGARVLASACFSYTASTPYSMWGEWLKALCDIRPGEPDEQRAAKIAARLAALGAGQEEWLPVLGDLARLDVPDNRLTRGLDAQLRQERRFALLEALLLRAADEGPLVVLFEDMHWADPISLELWRQIVDAIADRPLLLLAVQRTTAAPLAEAHIMELRELPLPESHELIAELAPSNPIGQPLRTALIERAAGNPLFLAELVRAFSAAPLAPFAASQVSLPIENLPDTLNGLLLARIDRLDETSRDVLRVASVVGQRVPFGVLQALRRADQHTLVRQLTRLDEEAITLLERVEPERVHAFRQALVQEVAYQSMLFARRRELHGRIGEYLERRHAGDLDDYYGLLAHHYRLSDQRDKAVDYLLKAGHAARDVYANEEAAQHYRWTLDALAGDETSRRAWEAHDALGDVYATIGRYGEALEQHAAILAAPGVSAEAARRAHRKRGNILEKLGSFAAALDELDQAMALARSGAPGISPLAVPTICADISLVHKRRGAFDLAEAACEQGLTALRTTARTRQDELIEARLRSELGTIYGIRGDYARARREIERSLQMREAIDDLPGVVASHNNLGYLWQLQGDYGRAIEHYRVVEELARKIGLRYMLIHAATNAAYALTTLGRYAEAQARCDEALVIARELNAQQTISQIQNTLGIIFYRTGAYQDALAAYDAALQINRALSSAHEEANALMHRAQVLVALGETHTAQTLADDALERAIQHQAQALQVEVLNTLAEIALVRGDPQLAMTYAAEARALALAIGSDDDLGVADRLLGSAAVPLGQPFEQHFDASISRFEQAGDAFELARSLAAYGEALSANGNHDGSRAYLFRARATFIALGAAGELRRLTAILERSP